MNSNQWESVMSHKLKQDVSIGGNLKRLRLKAGYTQEEVTVKLLGGELNIFWDRKADKVYMTGPASVVFEGEIEIEE